MLAHLINLPHYLLMANKKSSKKQATWQDHFVGGPVRFTNRGTPTTGEVIEICPEWSPFVLRASIPGERFPRYLKAEEVES